MEEIRDRRREGETQLRQVQLVQLRLLEIFAQICHSRGLSYWLDFGTLLGAVRHGGFIPWDDDVDVSMPRRDFNVFKSIAPSILPPDVFMQTMHTDPAFDIYCVGMKLRDNLSTMIEDPMGTYHQGIYIDVFPYDKTPANKVLRHLQRRLYKTLVTGSYQNFGGRRMDIRRFRRTILRAAYRIADIETVENAILSMYRIDKEYRYRPNLASRHDDHYFTESQLFPLSEIGFEGEQFSCPGDALSWLTTLYGDYRELPPPEKRVPSHIKAVDPFTPYHVYAAAGGPAGCS